MPSLFSDWDDIITNHTTDSDHSDMDQPMTALHGLLIGGITIIVAIVSGVGLTLNSGRQVRAAKKANKIAQVAQDRAINLNNLPTTDTGADTDLVTRRNLKDNLKELSDDIVRRITEANESSNGLKDTRLRNDIRHWEQLNFPTIKPFDP